MAGKKKSQVKTPCKTTSKRPTYYCVCKSTDGSGFMIRCDGCLKWFHGSCVGVSEAEGTKLEQESSDWLCFACFWQRKEHQLKTLLESKRQEIEIITSANYNLQETLVNTIQSYQNLIKGNLIKFNELLPRFDVENFNHVASQRRDLQQQQQTEAVGNHFGKDWEDMDKIKIIEAEKQKLQHELDLKTVESESRLQNMLKLKQELLQKTEQAEDWERLQQELALKTDESESRLQIMEGLKLEKLNLEQEVLQKTAEAEDFRSLKRKAEDENLYLKELVAKKTKEYEHLEEELAKSKKRGRLSLKNSDNFFKK